MRKMTIVSYRPRMGTEVFSNEPKAIRQFRLGGWTELAPFGEWHIRRFWMNGNAVGIVKPANSYKPRNRK